MRLSPIAKAVVAFVGGLGAFLVGVLGDGRFDSQDVGLLAVWFLQTFGVYQVPNKE